MDAEYLLEMNNITKNFPGVRALSNVVFKLKRNTVHALVGENGAGKSTLMKILSGTYSDFEGDILLEGKNVHFKNERAALDAGIAIVSQELTPIPDLTIAQNIFIGREPETIKGFIANKKTIEMSRELLTMLGLHFDPRTKMRGLSVAEKQMVEIIKAISRNAKIIIMDEPSSALTNSETKYLFEQIRKLKSQGISIIYISHKLEEVFEVCDEVTVLRDGRLIGGDKISNLQTSQVITMMVGRVMTDMYPPVKESISDVCLEVRNLTCHGEYSDISFSVGKGEILGIAGMMGAGRSEVARAVFGLDKPDTGEIRLNGKRIRIRSTGDAIKNGIAMISEDRATFGFVGVRSIKDNIMLSNTDTYAPGLFIKKKKINKDSGEICKKLAVKAPDTNTLLLNLSGGNQQKVVLAKWVIRNIKVLIMDEPTRGIDVGAKFEIYKIMTELAQQGISIIMISSELPEIIGMSHRVLVMAEGRILKELKRSELTQERIMQTIVEG